MYHITILFRLSLYQYQGNTNSNTVIILIVNTYFSSQLPPQHLLVSSPGPLSHYLSLKLKVKVKLGVHAFSKTGVLKTHFNLKFK